MKSEPGDETITFTHGIVRPPTSQQIDESKNKNREGIVRPPTSRQDIPFVQRHREASNITTCPRRLVCRRTDQSQWHREA